MFCFEYFEGEINDFHLLNRYITITETALIMNAIDFSSQNTQNRAFENPTIPRYSLKNWPEELGLTLICINKIFDVKMLRQWFSSCYYGNMLLIHHFFYLNPASRITLVHHILGQNIQFSQHFSVFPPIHPGWCDNKGTQSLR